MAEYIHTFTAGKMNKDLDERLVPNGEYIDALNIEISNSESSNVGALQNIRGNKLINTKTKNPSTLVTTEWITKFGLTSPRAIGVYVDTRYDRIYWFIASDNISCILEYDQVSGVISPVLVDANSILKFSKDYLITGVNIIDDWLLFTDDQTEPKKISIKLFKEAAKNSDTRTHTKLWGRDFIESDITVIKKNPTKAPTIKAANTRQKTPKGEPAIVEAQLWQNFSEIVDNENVPWSLDHPAFTVQWLVSTPGLYFAPDDILLLSTVVESDTEETEYSLKLKVLEFNSTSALVKLHSISDTPNNRVLWEVVLEEEPALFEFKFPRFAYRYKYLSGEYSTYSPFSEVAFLPSVFDYNTYKGYNLGMINTIRQLTVTNFVEQDIDPAVTEIELLYKESDNSSVYIVDSFDAESEAWKSNEFNIEAEVFGAVVDSLQLLRPWDNVPLKAKAQEISGNRLIYGNYLQNYNMFRNGEGLIRPSIAVSTTFRQEFDEESQSMKQVAVVPSEPYKSIKSLRTLQSGVVYQDLYGRQTPVFTSKESACIIPKSEADKYNQLSLQLTTNPPDFATHFKFFIKETSNEYYNLAMDRHYTAEDGNIWLAFPSSERNKVAEGDFIILKKKHNSNVFVSDPARYKIIDISNEAPDILKEIKKSKGAIETDFTTSGFPLADMSKVKIPAAEWENSSFKSDTFDIQSLSNLVTRVISSSNTSKWYDIASISKIGEEYEVSTIKRFDDVDFAGTFATPAGGLGMEIAQVVSENKAEYTGRFFVKVYSDVVLKQNILDEISEIDYGITTSNGLMYINTTSDSRDYWKQRQGWFADSAKMHWTIQRGGTLIDKSVAEGIKIGTSTEGTGYMGRGIKVGKRYIDISYANWAGDSSRAWTSEALWYNFDTQAAILPYRDFIKSIEDIGSKFRFKDDPDQIVYTIEGYARIHALTYGADGREKRGKFASSRVMRFTIKLDKPLEWVPTTFVGASNFNPDGIIEFLNTTSDSEKFTSDNPAIWETEPKKAIDLDLYYEASDAFPIAEHNDIKLLDWSNCYSFGNGVESNRIRDDFNAIYLDKGAKVSTILGEQYNQERKTNGLIWSGIYNSNSGINRLNQFVQADTITKDIYPVYGPIQKLHSRDSDLVILCEDKILHALANKDALYNADGNPQLISSNNVIGEVTTYSGDFGISKNPESFASYGFRSYFTDKSRQKIFRLSMDGLTDISGKGISDFLSDNIASSSTMVGAYNAVKDTYEVSLDSITPEWKAKLESEDWVTVAFNEGVDGWISRYSYFPELGCSLNNKYYTFKDGELWEQHIGDINTFYNTKFDSTVNFLVNEDYASVKQYQAMNYTGTQSRKYKYEFGKNADSEWDESDSTQDLIKKGWHVYSANTDLQESEIKEFVDKEGKWFNYFKGINTYFNTNDNNNVDSREFSVQGIGQMILLEGPGVTAHYINAYVSGDCSTSINPPVTTSTTVYTNEDTSITIDVSKYVKVDPTDQVTFGLKESSIIAGSGVLGTINTSTGVVQFIPFPDYNGPAGLFEYSIQSQAFGEYTGFVTIEVLPVADAPFFTSSPPQGTYEVGDGYSYNIVCDDVDLPDDFLTITAESALPAGFVLVSSPLGDGAATLTNSNLSEGSFTITLIVTDNAGNKAKQTVTNEVLNVTPEAYSRSITVNEDGYVDITLTGFSPTGSNLTYTITSNNVLLGRLGTYSAVTKTVRYTPDPDKYGSGGSFDFIANNGIEDSEFATITITVLPINDAPYFNNDAFVLVKGVPAINLIGITKGDTFSYTITVGDVDNLPEDLVVSSVNPLPAGISLSYDNKGKVILSSTDAPVGNFDITLKVQDPFGASDTHLINIGSNLAGSLATLVIRGISDSPQAGFNWVDEENTTIAIAQSPAGITHACNQGTYLLRLEGIDIGRFYVSNNYGANSFDSFSLTNGNPSSKTGDLMLSSASLATRTDIPSANAQGVTITRIRMGDPYVNPNRTSFYSGYRANIIKLNEATIAAIVAVAADPAQIKLQVLPDTYSSNRLNTHTQGFGLQMFLNKKQFFSSAFGSSGPPNGSTYAQVMAFANDSTKTANTIIFNGLTGKVVSINGVPQT